MRSEKLIYVKQSDSLDLFFRIYFKSPVDIIRFQAVTLLGPVPRERRK